MTAVPGGLSLPTSDPDDQEGREGIGGKAPAKDPGDAPVHGGSRPGQYTGSLGKVASQGHAQKAPDRPRDGTGCPPSAKETTPPCVRHVRAALCVFPRQQTSAGEVAAVPPGWFAWGCRLGRLTPSAACRQPAGVTAPAPGDLLPTVDGDCRGRPAHVPGRRDRCRTEGSRPGRHRAGRAGPAGQAPGGGRQRPAGHQRQRWGARSRAPGRGRATPPPARPRRPGPPAPSGPPPPPGRPWPGRRGQRAPPTWPAPPPPPGRRRGWPSPHRRRK